MNAAVENLPPAEEFLDPCHNVAMWGHPEHPNLGKVRRDAQILVAKLEYVANLRIEMQPEVHSSLEEAAEKQEQDQERALEVLSAARKLHKELEHGIAVRRLRRDVRKHAPDLLPQVTSTIKRAADHLRELRAILAFIVDEDDDIELGYELVPTLEDSIGPSEH